MRSLLCCLMLMGVLIKANPVPFYQEPAKLDTPDDQDVVVATGTGVNANPQGGFPVGSSFFILPTGDSSSSSSSSSSEEDYGSDAYMPDGGGSVPTGTATPGGLPVGGAANGATGGEAGTGRRIGQGGRQGVSDENSDEVPGGGLLIAGLPAKISDIQAKPKAILHHTSAGKSAGIAIGVLVLISVAIVAIIFTIRKRRNGFMRFYSQANAEL